MFEIEPTPTLDSIVNYATVTHDMEVLQESIKYIPKDILDQFERMDFSEYDDWIKWTGPSLEPKLRKICLRVLSICQHHKIKLEPEK